MKTNLVKIKRRGQSGHIMLPAFGIAYLYTVFLPIVLFAIALLEYLKAAAGAPIDITWWQKTLVLGIGLPISVIALMLGSIFLGMFVPATEAESERVGFGARQYWHGKSIKEKLCREFWRIAFFFGTAAAAVPVAMLFPDLKLQFYGFFAIWQLLMLAVFHFVINPVKYKWPTLGGFAGDPNARYHHVF